jgi:hypothetical protein
LRDRFIIPVIPSCAYRKTGSASGSVCLREIDQAARVEVAAASFH